VKQVARELGVRYVLEGSVRKAGNRVRITAQLADTTTGAHIWADRFDAALDDIFELQDQIAGRVVGAIQPKLRSDRDRAGVSQAHPKPPRLCTLHEKSLPFGWKGCARPPCRNVVRAPAHRRCGIAGCQPGNRA